MELNFGDSAFVLVSTALVFLMTPGLAFFYGGMVRRKNVLNTILSSFFICGLASVLWIVVGYSLSFGTNHGGIIGGFNYLFFDGVSWAANAAYAATIPETLFAAFQMMFAIITCALITGSLVGRMKFSSLVIFIIAWSFLVYYPLAHMVWGDGGFIRELGALDFAGGNVVHISSGVSGLVAITPGAGFVPLWSALIIGALVSPICYFCMSVVKKKFGYDDSLDAFGCHGIGGIWGGIATGLFANNTINPAVVHNGLIFGDASLFIAQVISIIITIAIAAIVTFIILKVIMLFKDIRVSPSDEANGLDLSEHNETAYPSFMGLD